MNSDRDADEITTIIRVSFANVTSIVAEMVEQSLQQHPGVQVVGSFKTWDRIDAAISKTDFLILGVDDVYSLPEACFRSLNSYPNLKILLLTTANNEAIVYWRSLHCHPIQVTSSQSLIESIRQLYCLSPLKL